MDAFLHASGDVHEIAGREIGMTLDEGGHPKHDRMRDGQYGSKEIECPSGHLGSHRKASQRGEAMENFLNDLGRGHRFQTSGGHLSKDRPTRFA